MTDVQTLGATALYARQIVACVQAMPSLLRNSARVSAVEVAASPLSGGAVARYHHDSRHVTVAPDLDEATLRRALLHEYCHAADDNFGVPHFFSSHTAWQEALPGVAAEEVFADAMSLHLSDQPLPEALAQHCKSTLEYLSRYYV